MIDDPAAPTATPWRPRKIFLFSGHMIDKPERPRPRFPADKEPLAARAIAAKLDALQAGPEDLAICGGACGGDTLFAEAAVARGLQVQLHLQFAEPEFLRDSVSFAGAQWVDRFQALKRHPNVRVLVQPAELGPLPAGADPYMRNNLWQLDAALDHGPERVWLITLWDGQAGDGPGGTRHMLDTVEQNGGQTCVLRTTELW
jgi:hypothetical protein